MSGVCLKVAVGASGGGGDRTLYDTRVIATRGEHERVWTQNIPEYVDRGDAVSYKERRADLAEFIRQVEEDALSKGRGFPDEKEGKERTFYRLIYAFHEDPGDEKIKERVSEHQRETLPKCYIVNAIHRNSGHVHVHSVVAARQTDGTKLHLDWREYRTLDETWAHIYGREFGEHFEHEHLEKKQERLEHRRSARAALDRGEKPPPRPERVTHQRNQLEEKIQIVQRERSITRADERGTTGRERRAAACAGADEGRSETKVAELHLEAENLRAEVSTLRGALAESERQRRQLQSTLDTLNETQRSLQELYAEKEDRLLGRLADEGAKVAAAGARWQAAEAQLRGELAERDSTIGGLEGKLAHQQTMLNTQNVWIANLKGDLKEAKLSNDSKAGKIRTLESQVTLAGEHLRRVTEEGGQSIILGTFELLGQNWGCVAVLTLAVGLIAGVVFIINSIISWWTPCETFLGS